MLYIFYNIKKKIPPKEWTAKKNIVGEAGSSFGQYPEDFFPDTLHIPFWIGHSFLAALSWKQNLEPGNLQAVTGPWRSFVWAALFIRSLLWVWDSWHQK